MKKVGIITQYCGSHNIGGLLQSYAMCGVLSKLGYVAEQLCYIPETTGSEKRVQKRLHFQQVMHCSIRDVVYKMRMKLNSAPHKYSEEESQRIGVQWERFKDFENMIPHSTMTYDDTTIHEIGSKYDAFVCGSDVVWHPANLIHPPYYLEFADPESKKIAYAASMGRLPQTPLERELFSKRIKNFDFISVREKSVAEYIESREGRRAEVVLDPTLLLTAQEWERIEKNSSTPSERYVFCYFLGIKEASRRYAADYAKHNNLKLIYLPYIMNYERVEDAALKEYGVGVFDFGPEDVVGLIHHAECVFTDSFHAVVFSTIFNTPFFAFDRDTANSTYSINSRIDDFLGEYGMSDRHIDVEKGVRNSCLSEEDRKKGKEKLAQRVRESYDYLRRALE